MSSRLSKNVQTFPQSFPLAEENLSLNHSTVPAFLRAFISSSSHSALLNESSNSSVGAMPQLSRNIKFRHRSRKKKKEGEVSRRSGSV